MRCPNCSKFVGLELQDPEINDLEFNDIGEINGTVRIVRNCEECGTEMKEANFDVAVVVEKLVHKVECAGADVYAEGDLSQLEEGGGRYKKSYYGAEGTFFLHCATCGARTEAKWSDKIEASGMDEIA